MKVVIDIDKRIYEHAKLREIEGSGSVYSQIIANGTPLPKGHGDLIDRDVACKELSDISFGDDLLRYVPTVIPADNSEVD